MYFKTFFLYFSDFYSVATEHYYPTLHQLQFEMEDGTNSDGDAIRFDYQDKKFPGYTWKGFVFVNDKQV